MRCSTHPAPFRIRSVLPSLLIVVLLYGHGWASSGTKPIQVVLPPLITRNAPPIWIEHPDSLILNAGESRLLHLRAVDPDLNPISFSSFAAPSFVVLVDSGNGSGALVVTPATNVRGRSSMLLIVSDSLGAADSVDFTVIVSRLNSAPVWRELEIDTVRVREGRTVAIRVAVDDPDGDSLIVSSYGTVHSALSKAAEGRYDLVVAPSLGQAGIGSITIIAADYELADTMHIPLIVEQAPGNHPPVWSHPESDSISLLEGAYTTLTPTVSDFDGDPLTISDKSEMETVLTHLGDGVYELVIAPAVGDTGLQYARVIAFDGRDADTLEIAVLVRFNQNRNHTPVINNAPSGISLNINRDTVFVVGATDADGDLVTFTTLYAPTFVSLSERPSSPPHARLADVYVAPKTAHQGLFQMYLIASDGSLSDSASLLINVSNVNYWPEIGDLGHHTIVESDTMLIVILASDANGSITTLSAFNLPANATFVDHRNNRGTFRFVPSYAQAGQYRVGFIANDGSLRDTAFLDITVLNLPRPPQLATVSPKTVNEGSTIRIPLSATDPDNDHLTLYGIDLPEHAVVNDSGNGRGDITFAPLLGQIGPFEMSVVASDGSLEDTIDVVVTVLQTSVPPDSVAEVEFITEEVAKYSSAFAIDQLHTEDLDLDGIDEVLFRESVEGGHVLRIWSPAADSFWTLPDIGSGIKSYTLKSGTHMIEPVVWTTENHVLSISADGLGWDSLLSVPDSTDQVQWLPDNMNGWKVAAAYHIAHGGYHTDPFGCTSYSSESYTALTALPQQSAGGVWAGVGFALSDPYGPGSAIPIFLNGILTDFFVFSHSTTSWTETGWNCGIPHGNSTEKLRLGVLGGSSTNLHHLQELFSRSCDLSWPCTASPSVGNYGVGLARWNDSSDSTPKFCSIGRANLSNDMVMSVLIRDGVWSVQEQIFQEYAAPARGGIVTLGDENIERMIGAPSAGIGYVRSIPDATARGRIRISAPGRFKTGYVMDADHRDMVFVVTNGIAAYRVRPYVPPRDWALVHHVPADFPTIQGAINAALSGDTILVAPGSYPGSIDFLGKDICVKSEAGAQMTEIRPASTTQPNVRIAAYESENAILDGFTIYGGTTTMLSIGNEAKPIIRNNIFHYSQGTAAIVEVKSHGAQILRNVISNNTKAIGLAVSATGSARVCNNTFDRNGVGISNSSPATEFQNNIVTRSKDAGVAGLFTVAGYNNIWSNAPDYDRRYGRKTSVGTNNLNVDPLYRDSDIGDMRLLEQSLCIDNGNPASAFTDVDGSIADIGAFSYTPPSHPRAINLDVTADDRWHLLVITPEVTWTYLDSEHAAQDAFEVEVGTDYTWGGPGIWSSGIIASNSPSATYAGPTLEDGRDYFVRVRVSNGAEWGGWAYEGFHTNGLSPLSTPVFPVSGTFVSPEALSVAAQVYPDPEGDSILFEIEIHDRPDLSLPIFSFTKSVVGGQILWADTVHALEEGRQYWWRARCSDASEFGPWTQAWMFSTTSHPIVVPTQQPTIQDGIRAIGIGDTVLVEPGEYACNLILGSKGITVLSTDGPASTIIRPLDSTKGTIVFTPSSMPSTIEGFTISRSGVFAIYASRAVPRLIRNVIRANIGAIKADDCDWLTINENAFDGNGILSQTHAAIALDLCDSISVSRNLFYNGKSNGEMSLSRASGKVINNTIFVGRSYGVFTSRGKVVLLNNIVTSAPDYAIGEYIAGAVAADYNCTYDNRADYDDVLPGSGSVYADPHFIDPASADFHLASNSPCIDAGHPDPQYNDPDGSRNDIGAFPYVPGLTAKRSDDLNHDGVVDVRDAVRLIDQTVRDAKITGKPQTTELHRVRGMIERLWGRPDRDKQK